MIGYARKRTVTLDIRLNGISLVDLGTPGFGCQASLRRRAAGDETGAVKESFSMRVDLSMRTDRDRDERTDGSGH
jgi:hypothetical protein